MRCISYFWHNRGFLDPSKKKLKNRYLFNFSAFRPHQTRRYTQHTCHLRSSSHISSLFPATFFHQISKNVVPAYIGSTILNIVTNHIQSKIQSKISLFGRLAQLENFPWHPRGTLTLHKVIVTFLGFSIFSLFDAIKLPRISITLAI